MENDKRTILIVEDDEAFLQKVSEEIRSVDSFAVLEAKDGRQGLQLALQHHPDLILLDIILPFLDGLTMLEQLRKDSWGRKVPVILLTNVSDPSRVAEAAELKTYDYLLKQDWQLYDVVKKIKEKFKEVSAQ